MEINSKTIVFITGAFVSNTCWDEWKTFFKSKGYSTMAPSWPHKDAPALVLRGRHPDPAIASIRLSDLIEHYATIVERLPEKPIVIGHSLGGLIVQLLLQRGIVEAGVAIHPAPPLGVITLNFSFWKTGLKALGLLTSTKKTFLMTFKDWQYSFTNGMTLDQQKAGYDTLVVPESKLVLRDTLTKAARVDFSKPHAPLLITSGTNDHLIPASLNYSNFKKYNDPHSYTNYHEFRSRNHFVLGQPTWQDDAEYIADWLTELSTSSQRQEELAATTA